MKRSALALIAVATLIAGAAQPALAAKPKPKPAPAPKPLTSTYYFHGSGNGNASAIQATPGGTGGILPMDRVKPTGSSTSDYGTFGAANQPNHECVGHPLTFHPTWSGKATGTLTGKVVVSFYARSTPGNATVQLFADVDDAIQCNEEFPKILAEATVAVPSSPTFGLVTATLTLPKPAKVASSFAVMITTQAGDTPQATDVGFDSAAAPSAATWTCIPSSGKKTC